MAENAPSNGSSDLFTVPPKERREMPVIPLAIAGVVVVIALVLLLFLGRGHRQAATNEQLPADPYAGSLTISGIKMSESTSLSNGKDTYIDGVITNRGLKTVTAATVQVTFRNDIDLAPQLDTQPLMLIRSREPYIDTQPVSAAPIGPGASAEFRLTFENITSSWNMQVPEIRVVSVTTR